MNEESLPGGVILPDGYRTDITLEGPDSGGRWELRFVTGNSASAFVGFSKLDLMMLAAWIKRVVD